MLNSSSLFVLILASVLGGSVVGQEVVFNSMLDRPSEQSSSATGVQFGMVKFGNRGAGFSGHITNLLRSPFFCEAIELTKYQKKEIVAASHKVARNASEELAKYPNPNNETVQFFLRKFGDR